MNSFAEQLSELQNRCSGGYTFSKDDRSLLHNAYWNGNTTEIFTVLELICYEPESEDLPVLLDASSPGSLWVCRCDAAQALGGLGEEGARILRVMMARETHPVVRFYVLRELIDLADESVAPFLDRSIPPNGSPSRRSLWIFGNFERGTITKEKALGYMTNLLLDPKRRHEWLKDHINS